MNNHQQSWERLVRAARTNPDRRDETAPYGFADRVARHACSVPRVASWGLLEHFALRGLIAACALSLAAVALGYSAWSGEHDDELASTDTVGEILDLS